MQQVSFSKWLVWPWGFCTAFLLTVALRADDAPTGFPEVPPPSFGDATALADGQTVIRDAVRRLSTLAEKTDDALRRAELRLAAANVILSQQLELPCTRVFWGLSDVKAHDRHPEGLRESFDAAEKLLDASKADLDVARAAIAKNSAPQSDDDDDAEAPVPEDDQHDVVKRLARVGGYRRTLVAFHQALKTALIPTDGDDTARVSRRAASELSALMENDDPRVAMAAKFWQAYLRQDEPDATAALSRLSYALDEVAPADQPYAFFSRMLRCRVLAKHDRPIAAITLLTQMQERALGWFSDQAPRDRALRAIVWTRVGLLQRWHDRLSPETQQEEREWCRERASELIQKTLAEPNLLPHLSPAIPMLLDPDKLEATADSP